MVKTFDNLPWIIRLLIILIFGWPVSVIYRIVKGLETKNNTLILAGIIAIIPIFWFIDLITTILGQGITILA